MVEGLALSCEGWEEEEEEEEIVIIILTSITGVSESSTAEWGSENSKIMGSVGGVLLCFIIHTGH